tara:strand:- start:59355 stop:59492 length:138 start_codon:yes stop_codon:yes gene_type:complete
MSGGFFYKKMFKISFKSNYYDALTTNGWYDTIVEDPSWIFFRARK